MASNFLERISEAGAEEHDASSSSFSEHAWRSFEYNLVQAPLNGITQIVDHAANTNFLPQVQFCSPPKPADFGTSAWLGDVAGGTAASAVQLGLLHRFVGAGAASSIESRATYGLKAAIPSIGKSMATGLLVGGLLQPVDESQGGNFVVKKFEAAGTTALTFGLATAGAVGMKSYGRGTIFANDILANGLPGLGIGALNADLHTLSTEGRTATWSERAQNGITFGLGGAFAGGVNQLHEYIRPTSGIRGVRTLDDMKKLADTTIDPDHPPPGAFKHNMYRAPNADELVNQGNPQTWQDKVAIEIRKALDASPMTVEQKKQVISDFFALGAGFEVLNSRPNPKPFMTILGSARLGENTFAGQRARYMGGLAGNNGYDVMSGGAPYTTPTQGGIMGMASKGGYEANTNVVGVTIKLPFEGVAEAPDDHHTLSIKCRDYAPRKVILNQVDYVEPSTGKVKMGFYAVEEAGVGTIDELTGLVTQIQGGKLPARPIYVYGETAPLIRKLMLKQLERGLISKDDLNLVKFMTDPRKMFEDLPKWHAKIAQDEAAAAARTKPDQQTPASTNGKAILEIKTGSSEKPVETAAPSRARYFPDTDTAGPQIQTPAGKIASEAEGDLKRS